VINIINKIRKNIAKLIYQEVNFESHFNVPIKYQYNKLKAVNERILEYPFIFSQILKEKPPKKILDFGCTRSWLSIALSSLGYEVLGIDLRNFEYEHKNFNFNKMNILDLEEKDFDFIVSLSTIEHVGLGVYDKKVIDDDILKVLNKINILLKTNGKFIVTLPVGKPTIDEFERSFDPNEFKTLLKEANLLLEIQEYYKRDENFYWKPIGIDKISEISNDKDSRKNVGSGVNGVGFYVFKKN
jgi:SAM-dependent methyltransferase